MGSAFWSADSRFIGFFAGGKILNVDVSGGPPAVPASTSAGLGARGTALASSSLAATPVFPRSVACPARAEKSRSCFPRTKRAGNQFGVAVLPS